MIGLKFFYNFSRQVAKTGKLLVNQNKAQALPNKQYFQSLEQVSKFVSENELDESEWIFIMNQMLKINKDKILDHADQEFVAGQLYRRSGTIKSKEFLRILSELIKSYKTQRVTDSYVGQFRALFDSLIREQRSDLFEPRSLIVALTILNPFKSEKQLREWDSLVKQIFTPETRIELSKLEIQIIFRLFEFCQKNKVNLQTKEILQTIIEENLANQMKNLQKSDLLLFVKHNTMRKDFYNAEIMSAFISRILQLKEQFTIPEVVEINKLLNKVSLMDAQWINHQAQLVDQNSSIENKILLCESLCNIQLNVSLRLVLEPFLKALEGDLLEQYPQMTISQRIDLVRMHSILLLCLYPNAKENKRTLKRLGKMNNDFYEIVSLQLEGMDFNQTLIFLENASVLGVSKRKVCSQIFSLGMKGLKEGIGQDPYKLYAYNQLLTKFITDISQVKLIEEQFRNLAVNTLKLEADFSHIKIDRERLLLAST